jgi:hypothetical protein
LNNDTIQPIILALGAGIGQIYVNKIRMAGTHHAAAEVDGAHNATLLMTIFLLVYETPDRTRQAVPRHATSLFGAQRKTESVCV